MTTTEIDAQQLADRYIAQWNLADAAERRAAIEALWAEDGTHVLQPPVEIREKAAELGFDHTTLEAKGYDAIETRVARSHERFVEKQGFVFRSRTDAVRLDEVVKFGWEAVSGETGEVLGGGLDVLVLDDDGRIRTDYMFPGA
ncbi:hypothetical protein ABZ464_43050 [Streptomyces sp. NPDC005820]|uniref:hypothetical protein n=1 Tax=Streptomyces sp. NPDC005820 TaxID=3157069 RepID=UPI0033EFA59B